MTETQTTRGFDPEMAGKKAECDGGSVDAEGHASREDFAGTLTGEYMESGDPPWRWYYMTNLTLKPDDFTDDGVWCETGFLFIVNR